MKSEAKGAPGQTFKQARARVCGDKRANKQDERRKTRSSTIPPGDRPGVVLEAIA